MPEEEVHGKKFAAVRIRSIRWLHDCQPFGLLEDGGPPPVNLVEFGALAVVILAVGVPEEDVVGNQKLECIKRVVREPEDDMFEKKMPRVITYPTDGLRKTSLENKMVRCDRY